MGRIPELYVAALGTLKFGCVLSPLFSAFAPEPIRQRLAIGGARALVTTTDLYRKKVRGIREALPELEHVLLTDAPAGSGRESDNEMEKPATGSLGELMRAASPQFEVPATDPQQMALLHFTSGTTGTPKGAVHVHEAVVAHHITGRLALDLHASDVFWCTADPGWVTGTTAPIPNGNSVSR